MEYMYNIVFFISFIYTFLHYLHRCKLYNNFIVSRTMYLKSCNYSLTIVYINTYAYIIVLLYISYVLRGVMFPNAVNLC